jgi:hypothetical protein
MLQRPLGSKIPEFHNPHYEIYQLRGSALGTVDGAGATNRLRF